MVGGPVQGVERADLDADAAPQAQRVVDREAVEHLALPRPGRPLDRVASVCDVMWMHQSGHSRAHTMHEVQAPGSSAITPRDRVGSAGPAGTASRAGRPPLTAEPPAGRAAGGGRGSTSPARSRRATAAPRGRRGRSPCAAAGRRTRRAAAEGSGGRALEADPEHLGGLALVPAGAGPDPGGRRRRAGRRPGSRVRTSTPPGRPSHWAAADQADPRLGAVHLVDGRQPVEPVEAAAPSRSRPSASAHTPAARRPRLDPTPRTPRPRAPTGRPRRARRRSCRQPSRAPSAASRSRSRASPSSSACGRGGSRGRTRRPGTAGPPPAPRRRSPSTARRSCCRRRRTARSAARAAPRTPGARRRPSAVVTVPDTTSTCAPCPGSPACGGRGWDSSPCRRKPGEAAGGKARRTRPRSRPAPG